MALYYDDNYNVLVVWLFFGQAFFGNALYSGGPKLTVIGLFDLEPEEK